MRVTRTFAAVGQGAYYYEDIDALQGHSLPESERWKAAPVTPGFRHVREVAECLSIGLELENGSVAWGDCVGVSYGGKAGREPLFRAKAAEVAWKKEAGACWVGHEVDSFRHSSQILDSLTLLSTPMRYGLSQALLHACALATRRTPTEVLCQEWTLELPDKALTLQGSSGNDRHSNADKMIVNRLDALPHTQVDDPASQFGAQGEVLLEYAAWLSQRIRALQSSSYQPVIHLDVHGALGAAFKNQVDKMTEYLGRLARACHPFRLRVESPVILATRDKQLEVFQQLHKALKKASIPVGLVVDEWVNSVEDVALFAGGSAVDMVHIKMPSFGGLHHSLEAVRVCRSLGVDSLLGGSCIETDLSTRTAVQLGLAVQPSVFLVKPGMGINEGISMVRNEMARTLELLAGRK